MRMRLWLQRVAPPMLVLARRMLLLRLLCPQLLWLRPMRVTVVAL